VLVPAGGLIRENELLFSANHWQMSRVHEPVTDVDLDINWVTVPELLDIVATRGAAAWFMFMKGSTLRDPTGLIGPCEAAIGSWFRARPAVLMAWQQQQAAVQAFKRDPSTPLVFRTQPAFLKHLESACVDS
jgi:hypothetical protein